MELRFKIQSNVPNTRPKLQFREAEGEWQDVPTVTVPMVPGEAPNCCGGGPLWGHAWSCPNLPD